MCNVVGARGLMHASHRSPLNTPHSRPVQAGRQTIRHLLPHTGKAVSLARSNHGTRRGITAVSVLQTSVPLSHVPQTLSTTPTPAEPSVSIDTEASILTAFLAADASTRKALLPGAAAAAATLQKVVSKAVNTKAAGLRALQASISSSSVVEALVQVSCLGEPVGYEALQILCYRNTVACQVIVGHGIVDIIALQLPSAPVPLASAMCYLVTALAAFNQETHEHIVAAGLIPQLVSICRQSTRLGNVENARWLEQLKLLDNRASGVLRNLTHNTKMHSVLIQAGAVDALLGIMRERSKECQATLAHATDEAALLQPEVQQDFKSRINAALAVAILVGHEEDNTKMQMDSNLVNSLLQTLSAATQGVMYQGVFWTVWKLCQGIANLTINDKNKELITAQGGIPLMAEVLFGKHHNNEAAHRYALSTLWNLAFNDRSRAIIVETPGLVEAMRSILATTDSSRTREVAKGALWTLGLEQDIWNLTDHIGQHSTPDLSGKEEGSETGLGGHIMLSYEWGQQQSVMLIKSELQKAGYQTWMDVDRMSGSTLEAMAQAVEGSAVVLVCVSKKYKESQACRTEAEYAFQQRKKIVPVIMERGYKPTGWLGALIGTRLYFDCSDPRNITTKSAAIHKELGDAGRLTSALRRQPATVIETVAVASPDQWTTAEVGEWLVKCGCREYVERFEQSDVDGMALSGLFRMTKDTRLVHEVLTEEFGITRIGHKLRLVEELHRLFS